MKALKNKDKFELGNSDSGEVTAAPKGTDQIRVPFGKDNYLVIEIYDPTHVRLTAGDPNGTVMVSAGSEIDEHDLLVSIIE